MKLIRVGEEKERNEKYRKCTRVSTFSETLPKSRRKGGFRLGRLTASGQREPFHGGTEDCQLSLCDGGHSDGRRDDVGDVVGLVVDADRGRRNSDGRRSGHALDQLVGRGEPTAGQDAPISILNAQNGRKKESSRDGDDSELALVLLVEDVQVELNPQPRRRVAVIAALDPEAERAVDLGHTDGQVDSTPAVQVTLVSAGLDGGEERVLDVHGELGDARGTLADVNLAGELYVWRVRDRSLATSARLAHW